ncbi:MAG: glycosyltransferase [Parvularculaceae bacterium]
MADPRLAAIVIGRNEGARLEACLDSLARDDLQLVYVDSGSADGSVAAARRRGAAVIELDLATPFTAARARNAGFAALANRGALDFVQFVDGDCAVAPGWLAAAAAFLSERPDVAAVCGRRRERRPEASVYNLLCDVEWATPAGEARACGGDFMVRREAFEAVGGFDEGLIAGEEPELCFRLRAAGWRIHRLDAEMTVHDAAMSRFGQWWRRNVRAGYAYANGFALHGGTAERFRAREVARAVVFGGALPALAILGALVSPAFLALFLIYPLQAVRVFMKRADLSRGRLAYAVACVAARAPEFVGVATFALARLRGRPAAIIEYK